MSSDSESEVPVGVEELDRLAGRGGFSEVAFDGGGESEVPVGVEELDRLAGRGGFSEVAFDGGGESEVPVGVEELDRLAGRSGFSEVAFDGGGESEVPVGVEELDRLAGRSGFSEVAFDGGGESEVPVGVEELDRLAGRSGFSEVAFDGGGESEVPVGVEELDRLAARDATPPNDPLWSKDPQGITTLDEWLPETVRLAVAGLLVVWTALDGLNRADLPVAVVVASLGLAAGLAGLGREQTLRRSNRGGTSRAAGRLIASLGIIAAGVALVVLSLVGTP